MMGCAAGNKSMYLGKRLLKGTRRAIELARRNNLTSLLRHSNKKSNVPQHSNSNHKVIRTPTRKVKQVADGLMICLRFEAVEIKL
jgi:hypothetical protein